MNTPASSAPTGIQDGDIEQAPLRKSKFIIYDVYPTPVEGWTDGTLWNGWATPYFEHDVAARIVDMHNDIKPFHPNDKGRAWYDNEADRFCFILEGTGGEVESYPSHARTINGRVLKLYPVGSWYWTWEEYKQE